MTRDDMRTIVEQHITYASVKHVREFTKLQHVSPMEIEDFISEIAWCLMEKIDDGNFDVE